MSSTANEFEQPGANYPDSEAKDADVKQRSDAGVGGAIADDDTPPSPDDTQDRPALAQNEPTADERLDGVLIQVRADVSGQPVDVVEKSLRRRLDDAGIQVDDEEIDRMVSEVAATP